MKKSLVCVSCPLGCSIEVEMENGEVVSVTGNTCKRGDAYARSECTNPVRSLATTVKVNGGVHNVVPCKSAGPLPKDKIFDCMKAINATEVAAPVHIGDIVIENVCGTGVNVVASADDELG